MLGIISEVRYIYSGRQGFLFFFFFLKVRVLQKNLGKKEWNFEVDLMQFVTELLILTNKNNTSATLKWLDL